MIGASELVESENLKCFGYNLNGDLKPNTALSRELFVISITSNYLYFVVFLLQLPEDLNNEC